MIIAVATDDGKKTIERHFGDAEYYNIYELVNGKFQLIDRIANTTEEEEMHADPVKAKGIAELLVEKNVEVGVTKVFGPNIKRIKKHFVPVLISKETVDESLEIILNSLDIIEEEILKAEKRGHIDLR
ncbi:MAG: dinitrogenase iron-molybdenum cofactor biosynthesis protein [Clostridiales bacterium]|nr:dinitrogenase iron-molybdenum cofactor biosynthesis protein [Clostridiales bacterium]